MILKHTLYILTVYSFFSWPFFAAYAESSTSISETDLSMSHAQKVVELYNGKLKPLPIKSPQIGGLPQLDGGGSSGGGSGIACFNSAKEAKASTDANGIVRPTAYDSIRFLELNDLVEFNYLNGVPDTNLFYPNNNVAPLFLVNKQGSSVREILENKIDTNLGAAKPRLTKALHDALDMVNHATVKNSSPITIFDDVGLEFKYQIKIPDNCRRVQLILRKINWIQGKSSLQLEKDERLISKLGTGSNAPREFQKAMLDLHEAIYLIASSPFLDHTDSQFVRQLTGLIMLNNNAQFSSDRFNPQNAREKLTAYWNTQLDFLGLANYFLWDGVVKPNELLKEKVAFFKKVGEYSLSYLKQPPSFHKTSLSTTDKGSLVSQKAVEYLIQTNQISEGQAFIIFAFSAFNSGVISDIEDLFVGEDNNDHFNTDINKVCQIVDDKFNRTKDSLYNTTKEFYLISAGHSYCDKIRQ